MPWRLVGFIVCIVLVTVFVGFNLDNRCDISFGFFQLESVPIFLSLMSAFVLGVVVVLPFTFGRRRARKPPVSPAGKKPEPPVPPAAPKKSGAARKGKPPASASVPGSDGSSPSAQAPAESGAKK